jgi:hypothetical protein
MCTLYVREQNSNHKSKGKIQICSMDVFKTAEISQFSNGINAKTDTHQQGKPDNLLFSDFATTRVRTHTRIKRI